MKHLITPMVLGASLLVAPSLALASAASMLDDAQLDAVTAGTNVHLFTGTTGQPSQTISTMAPNSGTTPDVRPGNAANAGGSAFNPNGNADTRYAGSNTGNPAGNQPHSSGIDANPKSVAQYDVAGFQQFQNHFVKK
jgi:hypothetical protein